MEEKDLICDLSKEKSYPIKRIITGNDMAKLFLEDDRISVSVDDYFHYDLKNQQALDEETYRLLKEHEKVLKAYQSCLRKLSMKDHTVRQIREHLEKREIPGNDIDSMIKKLIDYDLLNDEKYCQNKIVHYDNDNLSYRQIRQKLKNEGISEQLITEHLKKDDSKEFEKACVLAEKYERSIRNKTAKMKKQAILSRLAGQGYSYEIASKAADALDLQEENEVELLNKEYLKAKRRYEKKYEGYDLKNHIVSYLLSKGFDYENIVKMTEE